MDKKSILGFVLITIIITAWMFYNSVNRQPEPLKVQENKSQLATERKAKQQSDEFATLTASTNADSVINQRKFGPVFSKFANKNEEFITVETDLYKAILSTQGGTIRKWTLKKYKKWDKTPTQLIADHRGNLGLTITARDVAADTIDTRNLRFEFDTKGQKQFTLKGKDSLTLTAILQVDVNSAITRKITFYNGKYHVDAGITMQNMDKFLRLKNYTLDWKRGLAYQEASSVTESDGVGAVIVSNDEINELDAKDSEGPITSMGSVDFAATKTKYFTAAIIPQPYRKTNISAKATAKLYNVENKGVVKRYELNMKVPYDGGVQTNNFRVVIGPLEYKTCEEYGIQSLVNFGWRWLIRPIGEFFMLPFFNLIYGFIGNYGISILFFSLVMKLLLYPLSIKQMQSVHKMKLINPVMNKLREKYKDDQKTLQQETMKVYGEYGVNPAGGCLPMVLQMPILYALWAVMSNYIDLRQAYFGLWITDLSLPDVIFKFPVSILGIDHLSGLALLMGITMFIQQKMTVTDPKQKAMVYMMPIMFTLMFANFPAGLNLYYFVFNLLGILQQLYIEKYSKSKLTLEDLKKAPKKEGWMQKKMREAQEMAVAQGKIPPGTNLKDLRNMQKNQKQNPNQRKKK